MKRSLLFLAAVVCCAALTACVNSSPDDSSTSEAFPTRSIRVIVPYSAGGPADTQARAVADVMSRELGVTMVVENIPEGGGVSGLTAFNNSAPDGYTLVVLAPPTSVLTYLRNDVPYSASDWAPIGVFAAVPSGIVVPGNSPFSTFTELVEAAKADPAAVKIGTPGASSGTTVELERLKDIGGVPVTAVPLNGGAGVKTALLGNNITAGFISLTPDFLSLVNDGELKLLAVGSVERLSFVDAPTLAESGFPDLVNTTFSYGFAARAGTPEDRVKILAEALERSLEDPGVRQALGENYIPSVFVGPEEYSKFIADSERAYG